MVMFPIFSWLPARILRRLNLTLGWVGNHGIQIQGKQDADVPLIHNVRLVDTFEQMLKVSHKSGDPTSSDHGIVEWCLFEYSAGAATILHRGH